VPPILELFLPLAAAITMYFAKFTVASFLLASTGVAAFSQSSRKAFVTTSTTTNSRTPLPATIRAHSAGCTCSTCLLSLHPRGCLCTACGGRRTGLFLADTTAEAESSSSSTAQEDGEAEIPAEVAALDGVLSEDEAHNAARPARQSLKKKGPKGKPLSDFTVGSTVSGKVKTITNYGAFLDIGASTEGLLHISQLSTDFVSDVTSVLTVGQDVDVRIMSIDEGKNQVALTMLTAQEEQQAKENASRPRAGGGGGGNTGGGGGSPRRDDNAVLNQLQEKGWNPDDFVTGKVVSTVDFGAFVRIDASQLNPDVSGEMDGLVHISALIPGRATSVTSVVNVDDTVQVRVKGIAGSKVSLSMISAEEEAAAAASRATGGGGGSSGGGYSQGEGNKDWKEAMQKLQSTMPAFKNGPIVVDLRK